MPGPTLAWACCLDDEGLSRARHHVAVDRGYLLNNEYSQRAVRMRAYIFQHAPGLMNPDVQRWKSRLP